MHSFPGSGQDKQSPERPRSVDLLCTLIQNSPYYMALGIFLILNFIHKDVHPVQRHGVNKSSCHCCWQQSPAQDVLNSKRDFYPGPLSPNTITF